MNAKQYEYGETTSHKERPDDKGGWRVHTIYNYHDDQGTRTVIFPIILWEREVIVEPTTLQGVLGSLTSDEAQAVCLALVNAAEHGSAGLQKVLDRINATIAKGS